MQQGTRDPEPAGRIAAHIEKALAGALTSMTGKAFALMAEANADVGDLEEPIIWQQAFSSSTEPVVWLAAGRDLWGSAGELTLTAVGIDSVTEADCRSTWQEIAAQTMGALASGLTADLQREITTSKGEECVTPPGDVTWTVFAARYDETAVWYVKIGWSRALIALYDRPEPDQKPAAGKDSTFSKTFDLLLDVALPVNVSFGKTSLEIREVLKLTTGSIVELNRFVAEPVEVVVNDCVIARGEVVVVDGNYGVRITQLASREERLRFGIAETSNRIGNPGR